MFDEIYEYRTSSVSLPCLVHVLAWCSKNSHVVGSKTDRRDRGMKEPGPQDRPFQVSTVGVPCTAV